MNLLTLIDESAERFDEKFTTSIDLGNGTDVYLSYKKGRVAVPSPNQLKTFLRTEQYAVIETVRKAIEEQWFSLNVDEYLSKVKRWNGTNYDVPFDDGYEQFRSDLLLALPEINKEI